MLSVLLVDHLGNKFSSTQLDKAQVFFIAALKTSKLAEQLDGNGATDRQAHTFEAFTGS